MGALKIVRLLPGAARKRRGAGRDWLRRTCPPPDSGRGRGPLAASYRAAMTQMTMGGAGVEAAASDRNGVPPEPGPCLLRRKRGRLSSKKAYFKDKWQKNRLPSSFEPRFEDKSREKARAVHKKGHFCARDGEIRWSGLANDGRAGPANDGKVKADE